MADTPQAKIKQGGYLFPNNKTNDSQPDFRGKISVGGKEFLASGWVRKDRDNMIAVSLTDPADLPPSGQGAARSSQGGAARAPAPAPASVPSGGIGEIFDDLPG